MFMNLVVPFAFYTIHVLVVSNVQLLGVQMRIYRAQTAQTRHPTDPSDRFFDVLRVVLH